jgi:outer membrane protein assembly factor BamB
VASPLVEGDHVYVQAGASFVKLNKKTGESVWRVLEEKGAMMDSAFSSPFLTKLNGKSQVLVQTRSSLAGVEPDSGKVLWSQPVPAVRGMNILTPTVFGDGVFTSTYGNKSFFYEVNGSATEDKVTVKEAWNNKARGYMSSPVVIDGHAYLHLQNQRFTCLDLKTGAEKWTTEEAFGRYWSLVANKDRILALDERGELLLIKANPEKFELLDRRKVSKDETWGHLAVAGDEVFVRELKAIAAYRWATPK